MDIIIQIIGVLALTANFVSFQVKKHRHILFFRTVNEGLFILQYFLLGAFSGSVLNIVGCVRNIIFAKQVIHNKKNPLLLHKGSFIGACCFIFVLVVPRSELLF